MGAFGDTLQRIRRSRRRTGVPGIVLCQSKLAERAGFDRSYVSRLETGKRHLTREAITLLADALEATTGERDALLVSAGLAGLVDATASVLMHVTAERRRQTERWGVQSLSWPEWILVLTEEVGEAA